jgi:hypothetical protein
MCASRSCRIACQEYTFACTQLFIRWHTVVILEYTRWHTVAIHLYMLHCKHSATPPYTLHCESLHFWTWIHITNTVFQICITYITRNVQDCPSAHRNATMSTSTETWPYLQISIVILLDKNRSLCNQTNKLCQSFLLRILNISYLINQCWPSSTHM